MADQSDHEILDALGVSAEPEKKISRSPREERIVAGFEEVQRFVEENGHAPHHGDEQDIFEQLYAVRLDRLRELDECRNLLEPLDHQSLLSGEGTAVLTTPDEIDDKTLLAELGVTDETADLTELRHVRSIAEKRAAEEIANRQVCEDFEVFKPVFEQVQKELNTGLRETRHTSAVGIPASCSLIIPIICASVKRLFRICLLLRKVEQTLHQSEGSFGGQVSLSRPSGFGYLSFTIMRTLMTCLP